MTTKLIAATLTSLLIAGTAVAKPTETFTHDGVTYDYSVKQTGDMRVIEGYDRTNRRAFRFRVSSRWVDGSIDGSPVSFPLSQVKPLTAAVTVTPIEVAAR